MNAPLATAEALGELSAEEASAIPRVRTEVREARDHYEYMLLLARRAARELGELIVIGIPRGGSPFARRLANSFAWANVQLGKAAAQVVRAEHLPHDGKEAGIVHEVIL